jgi:hypothetical protein
MNVNQTCPHLPAPSPSMSRMEVVPARRLAVDHLMTRRAVSGCDPWHAADSHCLIQLNIVRPTVIGRVHCVGNLYDGQQ